LDTGWSTPGTTESTRVKLKRVQTSFLTQYVDPSPAANQLDSPKESIELAPSSSQLSPRPHLFARQPAGATSTGGCLRPLGMPGAYIKKGGHGGVVCRLTENCGLCCASIVQYASWYDLRLPLCVHAYFPLMTAVLMRAWLLPNYFASSALQSVAARNTCHPRARPVLGTSTRRKARASAPQ